ncbi:MAG: UDP-3-O-acyl-N-acetylglucosamine deacetylase [Deinococcales bacterium]|nr:UDP-3-O-acyl-N-acetylglucosamine deacetylase [Deinococcales bacterium]
MIEGITLHGGTRSKVRIFQDSGAVRFRRAGQEIPAKLSAVTGTDRCTVLGVGPARVAVVEHLLASLYTLDLWTGLVIEVDNDELPILDGSAQPWIETLAPFGKGQKPIALQPKKGLNHRQGSSSMMIEPGEHSLCTKIEFPHPAIGHQAWCGGPDSFSSLLGARTFGFLSEAEKLKEAGLALGASLENAIVFDDMGPLRPLRFPDELARHKALDALGDMFLLGYPLEGKITVTRGSHKLHVDFLKELFSEKPPEMDL